MRVQLEFRCFGGGEPEVFAQIACRLVKRHLEPPVPLRRRVWSAFSDVHNAFSAITNESDVLYQNKYKN